MKPVWEFFWIKGKRPMKVLPMGSEACIPQIHLSNDPM
jgi:hypothetical protein